MNASWLIAHVSGTQSVHRSLVIRAFHPEYLRSAHLFPGRVLPSTSGVSGFPSEPSRGEKGTQQGCALAAPNSAAVPSTDRALYSSECHQQRKANPNLHRKSLLISLWNYFWHKLHGIALANCKMGQKRLYLILRGR